MIKNQHLIRLYAQHKKNHRRVLISVRKSDDIKLVKYHIISAYNAYVSALKLNPIPIKNYDIQLYIQGFQLMEHYISQDVFQQEQLVHFKFKQIKTQISAKQNINDRMQQQSKQQIQTQHSIESKNLKSQNTMIQYLIDQQVKKDLVCQHTQLTQMRIQNTNQKVQHQIKQKKSIQQQKIYQQQQIFYQELIGKPGLRLLKIISLIDNYLIYIQKFRKKIGENILRLTEDLYTNYSIQIQIRDFSQILQISPEFYHYDKNQTNFFIYCLKRPINLHQRHTKFKKKLISHLKINPNYFYQNKVKYDKVQNKQNSINPLKQIGQPKNTIQLNLLDVLSPDKNIRDSFSQKIYQKVKKNEMRLQQQLNRLKNRDKKKQDYAIILQTCQMISVYKQAKMEKKWLIKELSLKTVYSEDQIIQFLQYSLTNSNYFKQNENNGRKFLKANHAIYTTYLQFLRC